MQLREAPLAIVDLETTGGHPAHDRITEIAVLEVEGFEVKREWSSLVNPGRSIPGAIQALTGITQEMVEDAPRFEQLAAELHARLHGRVFVAHNARFDYGFLRHEFERAGMSFRAKTLCTVKLSRRLYRGASGHSLDALIARHGIRCDARHRAMGDAEAAWQFLRIAAGEHGDLGDAVVRGVPAGCFEVDDGERRLTQLHIRPVCYSNTVSIRRFWLSKRI